MNMHQVRATLQPLPNVKGYCGKVFAKVRFYSKSGRNNWRSDGTM